MAAAVVNDAALGGDVDAALLLVLGALLKVAVTEDLQVDETQADDAAPEKKDSAKEVDPVTCAVAGPARRHLFDP